MSVMKRAVHSSMIYYAYDCMSHALNLLMLASMIKKQTTCTIIVSVYSRQKNFVALFSCIYIIMIMIVK